MNEDRSEPTPRGRQISRDTPLNTQRHVRFEDEPEDNGRHRDARNFDTRDARDARDFNSKESDSSRRWDGRDDRVLRDTGNTRDVIERRDTRSVQDVRNTSDTKVDPRDTRVDPRESRVDPRELRVDPRDTRVDPRDTRMDARDSRVDARDTRMDSRDSRVDPRDSRIDPRDSRVDPRDSRIDQRDSRVDPRDSRIDQRDSRVDPRDSRIDPREPRVDALDSRINPRDSRSNIRLVQEQPSRIQEQPSRIQEQPSRIQEQPSRIQEQPSRIQEQPSRIQEQPSRIQEQPSRIQEQPSRIQEQPSRIQELIRIQDTPRVSQLGSGVTRNSPPKSPLSPNHFGNQSNSPRQFVSFKSSDQGSKSVFPTSLFGSLPGQIPQRSRIRIFEGESFDVVRDPPHESRSTSQSHSLPQPQRPKMVTTNQIMDELVSLKRNSELVTNLLKTSKDSVQFDKLSELVQTAVNLLNLRKPDDHGSQELSKIKDEFKQLDLVHNKLKTSYLTLQRNHAVLSNLYTELKAKVENSENCGSFSSLSPASDSEDDEHNSQEEDEESCNEETDGQVESIQPSPTDTKPTEISLIEF